MKLPRRNFLNLAVGAASIEAFARKPGGAITDQRTRVTFRKTVAVPQPPVEARL